MVRASVQGELVYNVAIIVTLPYFMYYYIQVYNILITILVIRALLQLYRNSTEIKHIDDNKINTVIT